MRLKGVTGLADCSSADEALNTHFAQCAAIDSFKYVCCDQKGLLPHLGNLLQVTTVTQLAERLGHDGPVEDLSMWLCLLSSPVVIRAAPMLGPRVRQLALAYKRQAGGVAPSPETTARLVLQLPVAD